jgi:hypothetical protein
MSDHHVVEPSHVGTVSLSAMMTDSGGFDGLRNRDRVVANPESQFLAPEGLHWHGP